MGFVNLGDKIKKTGLLADIPASFYNFGSRYNYVCTSQIEKFYIHFELELLPGVDLFNGLRDYLDAPCPDGCPDSLISLAQNGSLSSLLRLKSIFLDIISGFLEQAVKEKEYGIDYAGFYKQHETLVSPCHLSSIFTLKV